jgi:hypothetical protein
MNIKIGIHKLMLPVLIACFAGCTSDREAKLRAEAGISKTQAETIALARVPNGAVKTSELEKEKGRLIWSFDITTPDSKDITEVNVDAKSGEVITVSKETPEQEKKEKETPRQVDLSFHHP